MSERVLNHWAWGWAEKWPDFDARKNIAAMLGALHGLEAELREPVELDAIVLPDSLVRIPPELSQIVSAERDLRIRSTWGRGFPDIVRGFEGNFSAAPDAVARPATNDEVAAVLRWCERENLAVVPRGGGTSVVGGVTLAPNARYAGRVVLDLGAMTAMRALDSVSRHATIEAGATGPTIAAHLAPHGLSFRHYPQSWEHATLGGFIVTRAGGHYATGRTHIDDLVAAVEMVTPAGTYTTRLLPASGAGPCPVRLVCGSEGTLGVVTAATIRVQARPVYRSSVSVPFDNVDAAWAAARAIAQSNLWPVNCRLLDATEAMLNHVGDGRPVLLLGFEDEVPTNDRLEQAYALARKAGGSEAVARHRQASADTTDADATTQWRDAFLGGPYLQSVLVSFGLVADTFETATTWAKYPVLDAALRAALEPVFAELGGGVLSCRFTHVYPDGPAPYYTFVCASKHGQQIENWRRIKGIASDVLNTHGATITHHHAVGRVHRPWYDQERPPLFAEAWNSVRATFDPAAIMNPGVLTDR